MRGKFPSTYCYLSQHSKCTGDMKRTCTCSCHTVVKRTAPTSGQNPSTQACAPVTYTLNDPEYEEADLASRGMDVYGSLQ